MKHILHIVLWINALLIISCSETNNKATTENKKEKTEDKHPQIILQPFGDIPPELVESLYIRIKEINPHTTSRKPITLPETAYNKERNRYRADSLIRYLWTQRTGKDVIIGLTTKDISTTKGKFQDWGIMGLAYTPGYSCVVSTFRLPKKNLNSQFFKIAIHELGHTQGLPHCKDKTCYMRDAEGKNPLDEEKGFCLSCKIHLRGKDWKLE